MTRPIQSEPSSPPATDFRSSESFEAAKMRSLAEFAAGAGHEINNPVATIVGYAQQLLKAESDPDRRHALTTIGAQALRIRDMIGDIMLFARPPEPRPQALDLVAVIREVCGKFEAEFARSSMTLEVNCPSPVAIWADPVQLRIVISSLLRNSLEAMAAGGVARVHAESMETADAPCARFSIFDDGRGLSPQDREHLFDPFYSGRQAGRGLGFGLSKCWKIVTLHGGQIDAQSPEGEGMTITVDWPSAATAAAAVRPA
jgi:signal transduction histidine kinase